MAGLLSFTQDEAASQMDALASQEVPEVYFGSARVQLVGKQYYQGIISNGECVSLVREPQNQYDPNAVRVDNVRHSQVGHIKREMAAVLAGLCDRYEVRLNATIPFGSDNKYGGPLDVHLYGKRELASITHAALRRLPEAKINNDLDGILTPQQLEEAAAAMRVTSSSYGEGSKGYKPGTYAPIAIASVVTLQMDDILSKHLSKLFVSEYENMVEAPQPAGLVSTLYEHQRKALHWMLDREVAMNVGEALDRIAAAAARTSSGTTSAAASKPTAGGAGASSRPAAAHTAAAIPARAPSDSETGAPLTAADVAVGATMDAIAARVAKSAASRCFFWERQVSRSSGRAYYYNVATNSGVYEPPVLPRGGILADDMGLGKTLTLIALIVAGREAAAATRGPTLIVCPLSVMNVWQEQLLRHVKPGVLSIHAYHGVARIQDVTKLSAFDVVFTTYNTLANESQLPHTGKGVPRAERTSQSPLQLINWHRVVLDEAHNIRNRNNSSSRAAFLLQANCRWCLTGTPIQNRLDDMFSLVKFLRVSPFEEMDWWQRIIVFPIRAGNKEGFERLTALMSACCLRRTKTQRVGVGRDKRPLLSLPPRTVHVLSLNLNPQDRERYDSLATAVHTQFSRLVEDGTASGASMRMLELCLRLRQLTCHASLVPESLLQELIRHTVATGDAASGGGEATAITSLATMSTDCMQMLIGERVSECVICLSEPTEPVMTPCWHAYCKDCIQQYIQSNRAASKASACPLCRSALKPTTQVPLEDLKRQMDALIEKRAADPQVSDAPTAASTADTSGSAGDKYRSAKLDTLIGALKALIGGRDPMFEATITSTASEDTSCSSGGCGVIGAANGDKGCVTACLGVPMLEDATPSPPAKGAVTSTGTASSSMAPSTTTASTTAASITSGCSECAGAVTHDPTTPSPISAPVQPPGGTTSSRSRSGVAPASTVPAEAAPAGAPVSVSGKKRGRATATATAKSTTTTDAATESTPALDSAVDVGGRGKRVRRSSSKAMEAIAAALASEEDPDAAVEALVGRKAAASRTSTGSSGKAKGKGDDDDDAEFTLKKATPATAPATATASFVAAAGCGEGTRVNHRPATSASGASTSTASGKPSGGSPISGGSGVPLSGLKTKSVVFSSFVSFLDIIAKRLAVEGISFVRLDGKMSMGARNAAVNAFQMDPSVHVILVSILAGGTGITLTAASNCFVTDMWWNASAQDQAVDRIHRLGQTSPVNIYLMAAAGTIDDKIIELQTRKRELAKGAFGGIKSNAQLRELRLDDMKLLLSPGGRV